MRIVSWNMNRRGTSAARHNEAWDYLATELKPDIALVQEADPPTHPPSPVYQPIGSNPYNWGSAVVALNPTATLEPWTRVPLAQSLFEALPPHHLADSHPGASAVADVRMGDRVVLTVASIYGQWEMMPGGKDFHAGPRLHRILSDLTSVFSGPRRPPLVVAGDFNVTTQGMRTTDNEASAVFARLRGLGLADCLAATRDSRQRLAGCECAAGADCAHVKTFRTGAQLDYVFASSALLPSVTRCATEGTARAWGLSDHCPIVLELDLPA